MRPLQEVEQLPDSDNDTLDDLIDIDVLNEELEDEELEEINKKKEKQMKPHIIRRNVEEYLEQKALDRRLRDVFDLDF